MEGLPPGMQLEIHVLNGEKYKVWRVWMNAARIKSQAPRCMLHKSLCQSSPVVQEICPENTLLTHAQLKSCIISHHTKALLKRDGGSDEQLRCFLQLEVGAPMTLEAAGHERDVGV